MDGVMCISESSICWHLASRMLARMSVKLVQEEKGKAKTGCPKPC